MFKVFLDVIHRNSEVFSGQTLDNHEQKHTAQKPRSVFFIGTISVDLQNSFMGNDRKCDGKY
jgi:hypothetical protein